MNLEAIVLDPARESKRTQHAAGALVWRVRNGVLEVLLVHRPRYDDWSWPKGKLDPGESLPACAVREVQEETGVPIVLGIPLPTLAYRISDGRPKRVWYWAARPAEAMDASVISARPAVTPAAKSEIDQVEWLDVASAHARLTRRSDRGPLRALVDAYAVGWLNTAPILVVRHGRAKSRAAWKNQGTGREDDRPLTATGRKQAQQLVPLIAAWAPTEGYTSPWLRCTETLKPFAKASRISVRRRSLLTETEAVKHPHQLRDFMRDVLKRGVPAVVCTHRPTLSTIFETARKQSVRQIKKQLPREDPYLKAGSALVLHRALRADGKPIVVAAELHRPTIR